MEKCEHGTGPAMARRWVLTSDLPNWKSHEPMGLSFPICKRRGIFETFLKGGWMQNHGKRGRALRK